MPTRLLPPPGAEGQRRRHGDGRDRQPRRAVLAPGHRRHRSTRLAPIPSPYGALAPVADSTTGLPLLQLPAGFSYSSFALDRRPHDRWPARPDRHDGMAVMQARAWRSAWAATAAARDAGRNWH